MSVFRTGAAARLLPTQGATALRTPREPSEGRPLLQAVPALPRSRKAPRSAGETPPSAADIGKRYAHLSEAFAMTTEAEVAYADLDHALLLAKERGQEVPCLGPDGEAWTSDDYDDQQIAADRCWDCPALFLCERYAEVAGEKAGVWGGRASVEKPQMRERNCGEISGDVFLEIGAEKRPSPTRKGHPMTNPTNPTTCRCECGEPVSAKANYRPGHDARHAGLVARAIAENPKQAKALLNTLPSAALQAKATRVVERLTAKPEAKEAVA